MCSTIWQLAEAEEVLRWKEEKDWGLESCLASEGSELNSLSSEKQWTFHLWPLRFMYWKCFKSRQTASLGQITAVPGEAVSKLLSATSGFCGMEQEINKWSKQETKRQEKKFITSLRAIFSIPFCLWCLFPISVVSWASLTNKCVAD